MLVGNDTENDKIHLPSCGDSLNSGQDLIKCLFLIYLFLLVGLFPQRHHGILYRIVLRIPFCSLEFKMTEFPDNWVRKAGDRNTKTREGNLPGNVRRDELDTNFSINYYSSWNKPLRGS